jgi:hypothetical protein
MGFDLNLILGDNADLDGLTFMDVTNILILQALKNFWSEQGDYLSIQNAGTTSTISKVSKDGKEGFFGKINHKLKNVERYFVNTWTENFSQNSIDILLGKHA